MSIIPSSFSSSGLALLLTASTALVATLPAQADDAHVKSASYSAQAAGGTLHVISSDGKKWDHFKTGQLHFNASMKIDTRWPGYVDYVGIVLGQCGDQQCASRPRAWGTLIKSRDMDRQVSLYFNSSLIPLSSNGGIAVIPDGDQIVAKCNQHLSADGPTRKHTFLHELTTTFAANTAKATNLDNVPSEIQPAGIPFPTDVDVWRHAKIGINVVCDPVNTQAGGLAAAEPVFKVNGIEARLMTFSHASTSPNPGTKCETGKARVRVATSKAGPVKFRLWSKIGAAPMQSQVIEAWSSFKGPGKFEAVFEKPLTTTKTGAVQIMAEDMTNPIGLSTGWKQGHLDCTGAGGGGLANPTGHSNTDNAGKAQGAVLRKPLAKRPGGLVAPVRPIHKSSAQTTSRGAVNQQPRALGLARRAAASQEPVGGKTTFQRWKPH